jgi:hypothetical protein
MINEDGAIRGQLPYFPPDGDAPGQERSRANCPQG